MVRDADRLDPLPDGALCARDLEYLQRHGVGPLLNGLVLALTKAAPPDPLQFLIDSLQLGTEGAEQASAAANPETGLPRHRQAKLEKVFRIIDRSGTGRMSMRALQAYANSHGGETLTNADLRALFRDFKPGDDQLVGLQQFLAFFGRVSRTMTNKDFDSMIKEMSS
ncbi:flagellar associated protein [Raphidocelis subcapitata]|uniref:Flagellar associated protein n=1 Tax=Raphidocelis subcapitata TaxID=307507 RepID=A0A2V0NNI8_9CHLO|nr:flagellar associated protein [Raphidocelis subcapitata]|eukprot:GBF89141.1 flagellar associated protein [Raphidocelis subcapitata]